MTFQEKQEIWKYLLNKGYVYDSSISDNEEISEASYDRYVQCLKDISDYGVDWVQTSMPSFDWSYSYTTERILTTIGILYIQKPDNDNRYNFKLYVPDSFYEMYSAIKGNVNDNYTFEELATRLLLKDVL